MQISSILDIVDGSLLNSPSISFIYSIKTNATKVKEGDLFIVRNPDDIEVALKNGAFALILDEIHPILDNEIAWIKVKDINKSIIQLMRFKLAIINLDAYYCDDVTFDLLKIFSINSTKKIKFIPNKFEKFFKQIDDLNSDDILICNNKDLLTQIYPKNQNFNSFIENKEIKNLIEHSLFEVSFSFNDLFFSKIKISSIYIKQFINVYNFLDYELDLTKLKSLSHFKPLFLGKNFDLVEFGKSDKFIICQSNKNLIHDEMSYLKDKYSYAKTIFISSTSINFLEDEKLIVLSDINDLRNKLKNLTFNAIYLIGYNYDELFKYLSKLEKPLTLF